MALLEAYLPSCLTVGASGSIGCLGAIGPVGDVGTVGTVGAIGAIDSAHFFFSALESGRKLAKHSEASFGPQVNKVLQRVYVDEFIQLRGIGGFPVAH